MKKRKYVIAISISVAVIFFSVAISFVAYLWNNPITFSIRTNWSINFIGYNVIYHVDGSPQNHPNLRELKYFTVLECKDFKDVRNKVAWKDDANENVSSAVLKLASELNVNSNYIPDFSKSYKYFTTTTDGIDTLYLIYMPSKNCVYVIEDINHASTE